MLPSYDDLLIKRFEQPDEVRAFEKGRFEMVKIGSMTIGRASYAGMEMVGARGSCDWGELMRSRTCRDGRVRLRRLSNEGWALLRNARGRFVFHRTRSRQLGCRRSALCFPAFSWRGTLRAARSLRSTISSAYRDRRDLAAGPRLVCFESAAFCLR
jgi:hypothetical protein